MYIGKTASTLRSRMNGYKNAAVSQRTNIRVKNEIINKLKADRVVQIFVLLDKANLMFKNYKVSLSAGLEDNLIAAIRPQWNYRGNNRIKVQELPQEDDNVILETTPPIIGILKTVKIKLGSEYLKNGFFNFSKKDLNFLPEEPMPVNIYLGHDSQYCFQGRFLFANQNGQPRVHGNKNLKNWFLDKNYRKGDIITIDIITHDTYRLN